MFFKYPKTALNIVQQKFLTFRKMSEAMNKGTKINPSYNDLFVQYAVHVRYLMYFTYFERRRRPKKRSISQNAPSLCS